MSDSEAIRDAALYRSEQAKLRAKRALQHYFGAALGGLDNDAAAEIDSIVDDIVEAAVASVKADLATCVRRMW